MDRQLQKGDAEISATHDVVLVLQTNVEHLTDDVTEIKTDQKSILSKLAELVSR